MIKFFKRLICKYKGHKWDTYTVSTGYWMGYAWRIQVIRRVISMVFEVKIKFLHKGSKKENVECKDGFTAISKALETLNSTEKDNVSAVLITDIKY